MNNILNNSSTLSLKYTWADVGVVQLIINGAIVPNKEMIRHYDFNKNGKVDAADYLMLVNALAELEIQEG